jgi:long-chain acyl-CoA synthetase
MQSKPIAIIGELSTGWMVSYLGIVNIQGIALLIDKELSVNDINEQIVRTGAEVIIYSNRCSKKVKELINLNKDIRCIIGIDVKIETDRVESLELNESLSCVDRQSNNVVIDIDKTCTIVYTSGTMGKSKGVQLSHRNICTNVLGALSLVSFKSTDISLSVLPVHHLYELTCSNFIMLYSGGTICINDSLQHLSKNMKLFHPTVMFIVPLFIDSFKKNVKNEIKSRNKESAIKLLTNVGKLLLKLHIDIRKIFFKSIIDSFGGNIKRFIVGGAPIDEESLDYFRQFAIDVIQGYGISECSPLVSVNGDICRKRDSVGKVIQGCEVKVIDGELCVKGTSVMIGYYNDEQATNEAIVDGWFKTGDLGNVDEEGYVFIKGRKKRLIILDNGENVSPEELENVLRNIKYIAEIYVYDDIANQKHVITAEIYPDIQLIKEQRVEDSYRDMIKANIDKINHTLPRYKQIANIIYRDEPFEKTSTSKIKIINKKNSVHQQASST